MWHRHTDGAAFPSVQELATAIKTNRCEVSTDDSSYHSRWKWEHHELHKVMWLVPFGFSVIFEWLCHYLFTLTPGLLKWLLKWLLLKWSNLRYTFYFQDLVTVPVSLHCWRYFILQVCCCLSCLRFCLWKQQFTLSFLRLGFYFAD